MNSRRVQFTSLYTIAFLYAGCASKSPNQRDSSQETGIDATTTSADSGTLDSDLINSALWFQLDATATVEEGAISALSLTLSTFAEPEDGPLCEDEIEINRFAQIDPPYEIIDLWWNVDWNLSTITCTSPDRLPTELTLGMGDLLEDLTPYLAAHGITEAKGGAFASFGELEDNSEERVYAYGYLSHVGSDETTADGDAAVNEDSSLRQDGQWGLNGLFLFPLDAADE